MAADDTQRNALSRSLRARVDACTVDELLLVDELVVAIERYRADHGALTLEAASRGELEPMLVVAHQLLHESRLDREKRGQAMRLFRESATERPRHLEPITVCVPRTRAVDLVPREPAVTGDAG